MSMTKVCIITSFISGDVGRIHVEDGAAFFEMERCRERDRDSKPRNLCRKISGLCP